MSPEEGRRATQPYRIRAGNVWYWVDPTVAPVRIGPGDTVVLYAVSGDASVATLQSRLGAGGIEELTFSMPEGRTLHGSARNIAALHLVAIDDEQT